MEKFAESVDEKDLFEASPADVEDNMLFGMVYTPERGHVKCGISFPKSKLRHPVFVLWIPTDSKLVGWDVDTKDPAIIKEVFECFDMHYEVETTKGFHFVGFLKDGAKMPTCVDEKYIEFSEKRKHWALRCSAKEGLNQQPLKMGVALTIEGDPRSEQLLALQAFHANLLSIFRGVFLAEAVFPQSEPPVDTL